MSLRERTRPGLGIIEPCLPSAAKAPPSGAGCTKSNTMASASWRGAIARGKPLETRQTACPLKRAPNQLQSGCALIGAAVVAVFGAMR